MKKCIPNQHWQPLIIAIDGLNARCNGESTTNHSDILIICSLPLSFIRSEKISTGDQRAQNMFRLMTTFRHVTNLITIPWSVFFHSIFDYQKRSISGLNEKFHRIKYIIISTLRPFSTSPYSYASQRKFNLGARNKWKPLQSTWISHVTSNAGLPHIKH